MKKIRVAVIGSGPAGFYSADALLKAGDFEISVDMYDRLPTPFGLVRFGVAPDHLKIKNVTRAFEKIAARPSFRFFGNVDIGTHLSVDELKDHYHLICFATGAQTDRRMGIPGEDLDGSHPATDFVAWYNGHPDCRHLEFDLTAEKVAVVGIGNVAVDVARILCRTPEELRVSDIADHALHALSQSKVREVYMLGRRGPVQAAYTNPEIKELGELEGASVATIPEEVALDPLSQKFLDASGDGKLKKKVEITQSFAARPDSSDGKKLIIRFLVSPVELLGTDGKVTAIKITKNRLVASGERIKAVPTDETEEIPVGLVFRSVGYRGVAIPGVPMDEDRGVIPNDAGRVVDHESGVPVPGLYVSGWIKRGPTGVIGTNKSDGYSTVKTMIADALRGDILSPSKTAEAIESLIKIRQPDVVSYADWRRLDAMETSLGEAEGRPRIKIVSREDVAAALA